MDAANFKIAVELIDVGIRVKDLSPWGTDEREVNAFVVFHDAGTPGMVLDQPMFDSWSIELLVNSTVEAEVYGVPFWDRATTYKAGDIVYGKDYNETDSPFSPYAFYKCIQGGTGKFRFTTKKELKHYKNTGTILQKKAKTKAKAKAKAQAPKIGGGGTKTVVDLTNE